MAFGNRGDGITGRHEIQRAIRERERLTGRGRRGLAIGGQEFHGGYAALHGELVFQLGAEVGDDEPPTSGFGNLGDGLVVLVDVVV